MQRGCFPAASGAGYQCESVLVGKQLLNMRQGGLTQAKPIQGHAAVRIQQPDHEVFSVQARVGRQSKIKVVAS